MNENNRASFIAWRFYLILSVIALAVIGLTCRIFDLVIIDRLFLRHEGDERVLRLISTPAFRGMIVDRHGFPLAVSTSVFSIWINPKEFEGNQSQLNRIAKLLNMKASDIAALDRQKKTREFVYLKRAQPPEIAEKIKALHLPGLYTQEEYRRYYPEGEITGQVIGFTNIDDHGQEGLELAYNQWLQGVPGKKWVIKDRLGRVISDVQTVSNQTPGHDLMTSIDRRIQYIAYNELAQGIADTNAQSGSAIVLDAKTGEILAMVNQPSFNPNDSASRVSNKVRNRAVTDMFEPGSTIKSFSMASALDSGHYTPESVIDTSPGWMMVGKDRIRDEKNNGKLTVAQILQISSNMGMAKITLSLPPDQLWGVLQRVGFGEITGIEFPGEQSGSLNKPPLWGASTLAALGYGYGISVTALQLARAYAVFADQGIKKRVTLIHHEKTPSGTRVISPQIAQQMLVLLESVVQHGTGKLACVPGYRVAGKTGTAWIMGPNGYQKNHYISSFVGIAPIEAPRFVVAVVIYDPQGKKYLGGHVAAPVFEKIMENTLRIMDLPPDNPNA